MKECKECGVLKTLDSFYKHPLTKDGLVNKCKDCKKNYQREHLRVKHDSDPEWVESERKRGRDKYVRLGYKDRDSQNHPASKTSEYKNLHKKFKIPDGMEAHHWDYSQLSDFIVVSRSQHKRLHSKIYRDGDLFRCKETKRTLSKKDHLIILENL